LALLGIKFSPGEIKRDVRLLGETLKLREQRAIFGFGPGLDRTLLKRLGFVGNDQIEVELDDIAEAMAGGARAERVVEREQPRLRIFVRDAARPALESLGEQVNDR
jgi:hypothetical protein